METRLLHCNWETYCRHPDFANLQVMRRVLLVVRAAIQERGARLGAYLFIDDRIRFLADGLEDGLSHALAAANAAAAQDFADSDNKPLWGEAETVELSWRSTGCGGGAVDAGACDGRSGLGPG